MSLILNLRIIYKEALTTQTPLERVKHLREQLPAGKLAS